MDALTEIPTITKLRLTEDFGTVWRDVRFDNFTTIVDMTIDASTGYYIESSLPNFMVNNPCLERLSIKFCPSYGRLGWSLDISYVFGELKAPIALKHLELLGRWKLSSNDCLAYLPHLDSLCISHDDDKGKSLQLLLSSIRHPLRRLSLPNGMQDDAEVFDFLKTYPGLEEFSVGPPGWKATDDQLRDALANHAHSLTKLTWEQSMFTCSEFDVAAVSQLKRLQSLSISLTSSMKNLVIGEVLVSTAVCPIVLNKPRPAN